MRILLTGSTGRLGGAFLSQWNLFGSEYEVLPLMREDLNLASPESVRAVLERLWSEGGFDGVVNPAAISGLEECLDQPDLARAVNVESPRVMAEFCAEKKIPMVHFSTDYVFDGEREKRLTEGDPAGAINVYGASKLAGERGVLDACPSALVCRVSWLFGPAGPGRTSHFENVLTRAISGDVQYLIGDKYSLPTFTHDIVRWVEALLSRGSSGVYHLCNTGEPESWMSYGVKICELAESAGYDVAGARLEEVSMEGASFFRDRRPVHTAMLPVRLIEEEGVVPRHWYEAAKEYLEMR
jgi:dTDP-4-dehydrorhamnose reductase